MEIQYHSHDMDYCPFLNVDLKDVVTELVQIRKALDPVDSNAYRNDQRYIELVLAVKHKLRWNVIPPFMQKLFSKESLIQYNYDVNAIYTEFEAQVAAATEFVGEILENMEIVTHKPLFGEFQGADNHTHQRVIADVCRAAYLCLAFLAGSASAKGQHDLAEILIVCVFILFFIRWWIEIKE